MNFPLGSHPDDPTVSPRPPEGLDPDPLRQFHMWFDMARRASEADPTAMTLATCTRDGRPSARIVLLKRADERGFVFYTNRESRKGRELLENPRAALVFHWPSLLKQVRIEGTVEPVPDEEAGRYFQTRPRDSQVGAWASLQSQVLDNRETLLARFREYEIQFAEREVPRPPHWGGFRVIPHQIEFWQSRPGRLHDRWLYHLLEGRWLIERLYP